MNTNENGNEHRLDGNEQPEANEPPSDSGSSSDPWLGDLDTEVARIQREEIISQRRRWFILGSVFPFLISAIALITMLAFNNSSHTSSMGSSSLSLRGQGSREDSTTIETSYLGAFPNQTSSNGVSASSTVAPSTTGTFTNTTDTTTEGTTTIIAATTPPQTEATSTTSASGETTALVTVVTTTPVPETTAPATTTAVPLITNTAAPQTTTTETITTTPEPTKAAPINTPKPKPKPTTDSLTCEEITNHDSCIHKSRNCVWFTPLNWSELCFTKPEFSLKKCKEVRLVDECLESPVGCVWEMETRDGPHKDICRFRRLSSGELNEKPKPHEKKYW